MADTVTLTLTKRDRDEQLAAREEVRLVCKAYLALPEDKRNPTVAEEIVRAVLDYFDGEEKAEGGAG